MQIVDTVSFIGLWFSVSQDEIDILDTTFDPWTFANYVNHIFE